MNELSHYATAQVQTNRYAIAYDDNYLEHHGVKGQKWGVRKQRESSGRITTKKGLSKGAKTALGIGAGILGAAAVGTVGAKYGPGAVKALGSTVKAIKPTIASNKVKEQYFSKSAKKSAKVLSKGLKQQEKLASVKPKPSKSAKESAKAFKQAYAKEARLKMKEASSKYAKDFGLKTMQGIQEQGAQRVAGIIVGVAAVPVANLGARAQRAGNEWINEKLGR